jgi:acyl-homoserine-lactone acylase
MGRRQVKVTVLGQDGQLSTVERTVFDSRFGPVLANGWAAKTAFTARGASVGNIRGIDEWLAMGNAGNVAQLRTAQQEHQAIPFVNTIASDSNGNAYFADASVVPHVTDELAARCVDTPEGHAVYPNMTILDGARTDCDWGSDPDAIEPGIFGPARYPQLLRADYVANSNDTPWLANPAAPITGYPRIFGSTARPRSLRDQLSHDMVATRRNGTDGFGEPGFDLDSLQQTMLGNRDMSGELLRNQVVALCQQNPELPGSDGKPVDVSAACAAFADWDLRADLHSAGEVLWREFWQRAAQTSDLFLVPFDPTAPLTTPNTLNPASTMVRAALADIVARFTALGIPLDRAPGDAQHTAGADGPIAVHGCPHVEGCFNVLTPGAREIGPDGTYPDIVHGSSFIMAAQLTAHGPRVRTILTYSLSANPVSPHHSDQTELFQNKGWVTDRFTPREIAQSPDLDMTILRE